MNDKDLEKIHDQIVMFRWFTFIQLAIIIGLLL